MLQIVITSYVGTTPLPIRSHEKWHHYFLGDPKDLKILNDPSKEGSRTVKPLFHLQINISMRNTGFSWRDWHTKVSYLNHMWQTIHARVACSLSHKWSGSLYVLPHFVLLVASNVKAILFPEPFHLYALIL